MTLRRRFAGPFQDLSGLTPHSAQAQHVQGGEFILGLCIALLGSFLNIPAISRRNRPAFVQILLQRTVQIGSLATNGCFMFQKSIHRFGALKLRRARHPIQGLGQIAFGAASFSVDVRKLHLSAVRVAALGGIVFGPVIILRSPLIPVHGLLQIRLGSLSRVVTQGQKILTAAVVVLGRPLMPIKGLLLVLLHAISTEETHGDVVLRNTVATFGGFQIHF